MARPSRQTLTPPSATSLRRFPGYSLPPPLPASAFRKAAALLLLAAAVALHCAMLYRAVVSNTPPRVQVVWDLQPWWDWGGPPSPVTVPEEDGDLDPIAPSDLGSEDLKLEQVVREASMDNETIILTTLNAAWAFPGSVKDLFIDSFRRGVRTSSLLKHLVIIAFDWTAYKRCLKIHPYCFALVTEDVDFSREKRFLTAGDLEMMRKRLDFLRLVLKKGYSFIFSDVLNIIKRGPCITDIGLTIRFLSTTYFGGICEPSRDLMRFALCMQTVALDFRANFMIESKNHDGRLEELHVFAVKLKKIWGTVMEGATKLQSFITKPVRHAFGMQKDNISKHVDF